MIQKKETLLDQVNKDNKERQFDAPLPTGGTLDAKQIVQVARAAGFPRKRCSSMTAIALAESQVIVSAQYNISW